MTPVRLTSQDLSFQAVLYDQGEPTEWIEIRIQDLFQGVEHRQEVGEGTPRTYRRKEALVIAMRQLIDKALQTGLISVSPSDSKTLNITRVKRSSGTSSTESES